MYQESSFKENLIHWFDENQREMPWRQTTNPYYIWLSEVMLQQTQVKTVIDYYHRFVERFPTVEVLSQASEDEVLKYWEGLGYYSRARNFHTAIKEVHEKFEGLVPENPEQFKELKGVGPYTQAAVMSIAFNVPLATVDGNVFRVWSRLNDDYRDIKLQSTRKAYEQELLPFVMTEAGTFNQAMMELGALICTPKNPLCLLCPVRDNCEAFDKGTFEKLPVKSKNNSKKVIEQSVFLIRNKQGKYVLQKRSEKLLHGMWQFPMYESNDAIREISDKLNMSIQTVETPIFELKHQFTHLTWKIKVYAIPGTVSVETLPDDMIWFDLSERDQYTFPVPMSKIYEFING
ncbi:A/G-specific adenine glycosylase [Staphylococcus schweitzeri]|uniref:Adenine DNA glycosylase n=1 Tax=Staphylococcus schweitzeri TaxID=1654388 RepID=A0A2K4AJF6_9STAP|nr:A/G-specific adenine glycosylase [Staphylococcus schweitzeri]MBE2128575.1 A/G-specific adenine glycosylase [Staphylococcus schweitzeri]PNZ50209.1 A/G-specific adenine glycosylase [Staphylococcus schweitzeri]CDR29074.1 HhH-GPD superfamily base excision DNA repair protein [Staphylococcus schweitzeri]CDR51978.1 HhH-GPD superfamily base excision DNA repair protein [Staphylococcus schweitzeri]CDR54274.1 HhH-GPD superfamily base excision DNA repair protein [Staphylococcus schweitzeri]